MNKNPTFLIIGANKAGTTSLHQYLAQHPEIFMSPIKEPSFFVLQQEDPKTVTNPKLIADPDEYQRLFSEVNDTHQATGESSTAYLANPSCAKRILDFNPKMKMIAVLRNPTERAYSNYLMYKRHGQETRSFWQSLIDELNGIDVEQGRQYLSLGNYSIALEEFLSYFPNIKIILTDDLREHADETLCDIFNYLAVSPEFTVDTSIKYNTRNRMYDSIWQGFRSKLFGFFKHIDEAQTMTKKESELLNNYYHDEIIQLSKLLKRDLSHWLS